MNIHPKVLGSAAGGAFTVILVWAVGAFTHVQIPAEVASAITTVLSAAIGYLVPSPG